MLQTHVASFNAQTRVNQALILVGAFCVARTAWPMVPAFFGKAVGALTGGIAARRVSEKAQSDVARQVRRAEAWLKEGGAIPDAMMAVAFTKSTADELVTLQKHGAVTAVELLRVFVSLALKAHYKTNCLTWIDVDRAAKAAAALDETRRAGGVVKPLHGLPISFKDNIAVRNTDTTLGMTSRVFKPEPVDAVCVEILEGAGAIVFAKTNIPQTLMSFESINSVYGRCTNPHNPDFACGGSSGGEGALVASGGSVFGIGTDIGGSIRIPALFCGCVGFKPSQWRVPSTGIRGSMPGQEAVPSVAGPVARHVADLVTSMRVLLDGANGRDGNVLAVPFRDDLYEKARTQKGIVFGYYDDDGFIAACPASARAVRLAVSALEHAGHRCVRFTPGGLGLETVGTYYRLLSADGGKTVSAFLGNEPLIPHIRVLLNMASLPNWAKRAVAWFIENVLRDKALATIFRSVRESSTQEYWQLHFKRQTLRADAVRAMKEAGVDCVLCPGFATPAVPHFASAKCSWGCMYTALLNLLDVPTAALPVTTVDPALDAWTGPLRHPIAEGRVRGMFDAQKAAGLPVGVQLYGPRFSDEAVLGYAKVLEEALQRRSA
jgi:Asp-tRNA(Asn)/Glu-tRNA(Gln) amidotransferase A subunit family amidase